MSDVDVITLAVALIVGSMVHAVACTPEPCTPVDLESGEMAELADDCAKRVLRDCGRPAREDCPTLIECDRQGEERCR